MQKSINFLKFFHALLADDLSENGIVVVSADWMTVPIVPTSRFCLLTIICASSLSIPRG